MAELSFDQKTKILKKRISLLYKEIQSIREIGKTVEENISNFSTFRGRFRELEKIHSDFVNAWDDLHVQYLLAEKEKEFPFEDKILNGVKIAVYECNAIYENVMSPIPQTNVPPSASSTLFNTTQRHNESSATVVHSRLPKITIPNFGGDLLEWPKFRDLFKSLVHEEISLSAVEKYQYLVGFLTGEPLRIVSAFSISETNYSVAWKALYNRYDNKRVLASAYLQTILKFKLTSPSASNSSNLRMFLKTVADSFSALNNLKIPNEADFLKLHLALECLDPITRKLFEEKQHGQEFPSFDSLVQFIQNRCQILELSEPLITNSRCQSNNMPSRPKSINAFVQRGSHSSKSYETSTKASCYQCKKDHALFRCFSFKALQPSERLSLVYKNKLCLNCLRSGHFASNCPSNSTCFHCKGKHHSLIHETTSKPLQDSTDKSQPEPSAPKSCNEPKPSASGVTAHNAGNGSCHVILGTALANIRDWRGHLHTVRLLIDSGSQFSIMTTDCANRLGLNWSPAKHAVSGIGQTLLPPCKGMVKCIISPISNRNLQLETRALVMNNLTSNLPTSNLPSTLKHNFLNVKLADEHFWNSRPIDFLLGSDLFFQILTPEPRVEVSHSFGTLPTVFGHVIIGSPPCPVPNNTCLALTEFPLSDSILRSFWETEEVPMVDKPSKEDQLVEEYFIKTVRRNSDGRYMVALPFRNPDLQFPDSQSMAMNRFTKLEARFRRDPILRKRYSDFMEEYIQLGHMKVSTCSPKYVIPHHAVFKQELQPHQAKLRVVFDASMPTSNGSLNDNLYPGPKLQQNIVILLLNFRTHRVAFSADLVKMFRQILVVPEQRSYQTILWRPNPEEAVQLFELQTITYGETSSPYLAIRTILQLVNDDGHKFPLAAEILKRDVYVDDIISGANSLEKALEIKAQLIDMLMGGCFPIHKWASNEQKLLQASPDDSADPEISLPAENSSVSKILGMYWNTQSDCLRFKFQYNPNHNRPSKRSMLSIVARLYDPLGLLAPIIFQAKSLIQEMWKLEIDWDDELPPQIKKSWFSITQDLQNVEKISIPRWLNFPAQRLQLFGFCDASEKGYGAVIFLRVEGSDWVETYLLTAKTRLAPVKTLSLPRLELCAAHLLTKLMRSIKPFIENANLEDIFYFSDSTVVLSWLRLHAQQLKTFVANRVSYIATHTDVTQWFYVPSAQNPADIASRGCSTSELLSFDLWWKGPLWMRSGLVNFPAMPAALSDVPEKKPTTTILVVSESTNFASALIKKFSSYRKLIAALAYIFRYIHCYRTSSQIQGPLSVNDLQVATNFLIRETQRQYFSPDFDFEHNECISNRFKSLSVFLDKSNLLRIGGRLSNSPLPYEWKHPLVLPYDADLTAMIIDYHHLRNFHLGAKALQALLQRQFYIFKIKTLIRKRIWNCMRCFRSKAKPTSPLMGDLPVSRISAGRPFTSVGTDFAGPYFIKQGTRRNSPVSKAYLCVFVCMAVKAVHLELVSSLSTEAFLAALSRFVARRGFPTDIFSDCGTNFVGASRHLQELFRWHNDKSTKDAIVHHTSQKAIRWHFNPPSAPHFGGLWEAVVKSAKRHVQTTLGDQHFHFEELTTIFAQIEAVLNSRPLCPVSSDPNEFDYLTPGHFLIGAPLIAPPEQDLTDTNINLLKRWQLVQRAAQSFWKKWYNEYIHLLQAKTKWIRDRPPLKIDDLVLIQDPNLPPLKWLMGRIVEVHPDPKGAVRVATVKTPSGVIKRPAHRLAAMDPLNTRL